MQASLLSLACAVAGLAALGLADPQASPAQIPGEAPVGFDDESNGLVDQPTHQTDREAFDEAETAEEGLGPIYNAQACRECHQNPTSGAVSQVTELRVGRLDRLGRFVDPVVPIGDGSVEVRGRSLVNDRAICPSRDLPETSAQSHVPGGATIRSLRASLNTLGDGFVEAIGNGTLQHLAGEQCRRSSGVIARPSPA